MFSRPSHDSISEGMLCGSRRRVNGRVGPGQPASVPATAIRDDLRGDRDRRLLGRDRTELQTDRCPQPAEFLFGHSDFTQPSRTVSMGPPGTDRADVRRSLLPAPVTKGEFE